MKKIAALIALSILSASAVAQAAPSKDQRIARASINFYKGIGSQLVALLKGNAAQGASREACRKIKILGLAQDIAKSEELGHWVAYLDNAAFREMNNDATIEAIDVMREYCRGRASAVAALNIALETLPNVDVSISDEEKLAEAEALVASAEERLHPQAEPWGRQ